MEPVRGWDLVKLTARPVRHHNERNVVIDGREAMILPEFVMVRDGHTTAHVEHTPTGWAVTAPRPISEATEALARMRDWMDLLTEVTA